MKLIKDLGMRFPKETSNKKKDLGYTNVLFVKNTLKLVLMMLKMENQQSA